MRKCSVCGAGTIVMSGPGNKPTRICVGCYRMTPEWRLLLLVIPTSWFWTFCRWGREFKARVVA